MDALRIAVAADGARPSRAAIDRYSYATLAMEMAEQVERAISARRGGTAPTSRRALAELLADLVNG
jgi:hypothetical protein